MRTILVLLVATAGFAHGAEPPKAKFKLAKDTTFITEPLGADGYLDYETALNERLRGKTTPETNAAVLLVEAMGPQGKLPDEFWTWLGTKSPAEKGEYFVGLDRFLQQKTGKFPTPEEYDAADATRKKPWAAKDHPLVAEWLAANEKPLALVAKAVGRPDYFYPLLSTRRKDGRRGMLLGALMPHVQQARAVGNALVTRAMLRAAEGDAEAAWQDLLAALRLGRLVARGGTHIETLVGVAVELTAAQGMATYLDSTRPDATRTAAALKDLRAVPVAPTFAEKMELGERFVLLDSTQSIRRDGSEEGDDFGDIPKKPGREREAALDRLDWATTFQVVSANYDAAIAIARDPDRAKRTAAAAKLTAGLDAEVQAVRKQVRQGMNLDHLIGKQIGLSLISLMLPAIDRVGNSYDRREQNHRNLLVAFALAAYRADAGAYPTKLADLAPKYLATVPDDLFSGKPLVYKPTTAGYLLYSVGENGTDDGGATFGDTPKGDDLPVRMPPK